MWHYQPQASFTQLESKISANNNRGEFIIVRGPSGGGKTTFLNLIGTIDMSTSGSISKFNTVLL